MNGKLLYDLAGAAELLTMSERALERLTASGEVASVKIGGLRRYRADDLVEFVRNLDNGAATPAKVTALADDHMRHGRRRK